MPIPNKKTGEKQSAYMIRCVPQMMRYHDKSQAIAICYRSFKGKMINLETYNDYPQSASNNAKKVLRWRDKHGDEVKGMTQIGWTRANQLAKKENISRETIARMSAFRRHKKNAEEIMQDYKLLLINAGSFTISMTNIDVILKIILLSVTIGYTAQKWWLLNKKK